MMKRFLKGILLGLGLYYKVNAIRFRHDQRSPAQQAFYAGLINKSDLIFDVGANVGQRSEIFSRLAAKVVAFEPQAECVKHLKSRFMFTPNVEIVQVALSEAEGEAVLYESSDQALSSLSPKFIEDFGHKVFQETWDRKVTVRTGTVDRMIDTYGLPRFIKIDVEGWELSVLKGLSRPVPLLSFEFTPLLIDEAKKCVARLNEISGDYLFDYCLGEKLDFVLPEHVNYETFSLEVLPQLQSAASFGDIYAIMKSDRSVGQTA